MDVNCMDILGKIAELRKARGWSDYKLAKEAKISQSTLSTLEKNNHLPTVPTLISICNAFGMTLGQFFGEFDSSLSEEQNELLKNWSLMTDVQKEKVSIYMRGLLQK